jgi:hypothetical protein
MSVLSFAPHEIDALETVLNAACELYAQNTKQIGLRQAVDVLGHVLRREHGYQDELYRKHVMWRGAEL